MTVKRYALAFALPGLFGCRVIWGFEDLHAERSEVPDADGGGDALDARGDAPASDGLSALCAVDTPFDPPTPLGRLNSAQDELAPRLTDDELHIFFESSRNGIREYFQADRATPAAAFDAPRSLWVLATNDVDVMMSGDGLRLYFASKSQAGTLDLRVSTRSSATGSFTVGTTLDATINSPSDDFQPFETPVGLWFVTTRDATWDIWFASGRLGSFAPAVRVAGLAAPENEGWPTPSADGLTLYIDSSRAGSIGGRGIWMARRASPTAPFDPPTHVVELDGPKLDVPAWLSHDRCRLYFFSDRFGSWDLFVASRRQ